MSKYLSLIVSLFICQQALAGKLDDFEADATTPGNNKHVTQTKNNDSAGSDLFEHIFGDLFNILADSISTAAVDGGKASMYKARNVGRTTELIISKNISVKPKKFGEKQLPFARFDFSLGTIDSDIDLRDYSIEAGYGALSLSYKHTKFFEQSPSDTLKLSQIFLNYRMSFNNELQTDLGIGQYSLRGNAKRSDSAGKFALNWNLNNRLGFEYHYIFVSGNNISLNDQEFSLLYSLNYVSLKSGYRRVNGGQITLNGPFIGIAVHF